VNRRILLEWPDLGLSAKATLADDLNPELCDDLWNALPIHSIMNNAVITDGSMYCWAPMLSFAPVRHKERIDKAPVGRLRYSQNTGQKVIVQYAACNEDIMGAVLGQVDPEDIETICKVGQEACQAIFMTKKELHVQISRLDGSEPKEPARPRLIKPENCDPEVAEVVDKIIESAYQASLAEPEEHKRVRTGQNAGMGSCGQYFSTWEFVYSLTRDISMYTLYPIARLCRNEIMGVRQLERVYMEIDPTYTNLLGSYGMKQLREYARTIRKIVETGRMSKEEFTYIIDALTLYTDMLAQWSYFYYPWGIGCSCFRFADDKKVYVPED